MKMKVVHPLKKYRGFLYQIIRISVLMDDNSEKIIATDIF